eukprot:353517-Chlamydomonas_euryale.AAC.6
MLHKPSILLEDTGKRKGEKDRDGSEVAPRWRLPDRGGAGRPQRRRRRSLIVEVPPVMKKHGGATKNKSRKGPRINTRRKLPPLRTLQALCPAVRCLPESSSAKPLPRCARAALSTHPAYVASPSTAPLRFASLATPATATGPDRALGTRTMTPCRALRAGRSLQRRRPLHQCPGRSREQQATLPAAAGAAAAAEATCDPTKTWRQPWRRRRREWRPRRRRRGGLCGGVGRPGCLSFAAPAEGCARWPAEGRAGPPRAADTQ